MTLAQEHIEEYAHCAADQWYFITHYIKIRDQELGVIPMVEWPHLHQLLDLIAIHNRIILLKSRQVGITWILCALALWYVLFHNSANVLMFSRRETESINMKNRCLFMYNELPGWLQIPIGKNNDEMLEFPTMGSTIQSFPATEGGARSEAATLVILDEWAFQQYADTNYTAILPVVEHGKLVGLSTANGRNNTFYRIWSEAKKKLNSFIPIFIPYTVRPGRDEAWHKEQEANMPMYKAWQEYPLKELDAFLVSGTCMFPVDTLRNMPVSSPSRTLGAISIWEEWDPDHDYVAGIDAAQGIHGRDNSIVQILDTTTGKQVAKIHTNMPIELFAAEAHRLLQMYDTPPTCVEEQGQGRLVIKHLLDNGHRKTRMFFRAPKVPGFHTSTANRPEILSELEIAIRNNYLGILSDETVEEMMGFGYDDDINKFEAQDGHDDEVMALAFAWHMAVGKPAPFDMEAAVSYIGSTDGSGPYPAAHQEGELVHQTDWSKVNPFEGTEQIICWQCEGIAEDQYKCRTCRGSGKLHVYA